MFVPVLLGGFLLLGAASASAFAAENTVYRLTDGDVTHLTDTPTDPRFHRMASASGTAAGWLRVPESTMPRYRTEIQEIATRYGVSPALVEAVIRVESAFNPWAVSRKGAQGLMQLMPRTAYALGVQDSFNPRQNIDGGVRHLRYLLDRYPGNLELAVAAYNAGEGAVDSYRGIPPYAETQQYVKKVLQHSGAGIGTGATSAVSEVPGQAIYRSEDADGTLTFSNIPPTKPRVAR